MKLATYNINLVPIFKYMPLDTEAGFRTHALIPAVRDPVIIEVVKEGVCQLRYQ